MSRETDRETREFRVDVAPDKLPENWTLGQRVEVYIQTDVLKQRIFVPTPLIRWKENKPCILIAVNGKIAERQVKIGIQTGEKTEIVSGLSETDLVILNVQEHLSHLGRRLKK